MKESVYAALKPVKGRQQLAFALRAAVFGLVAGSLAGIVLGVGRLFLGWSVPWPTAAAVLAAGPVLGLLLGIILRRSWHHAAAAVDGHYQLKDRSVTALEFLRKPEHTELHDLQIADTVEHLNRVEPERVVPLAAPRLLPVGVMAVLLAAAGLFWPLKLSQVEAKPQPAPDNVKAEADKISEALQNLDEVAKEEENKDLKELVGELKHKADEMKQDGIDEREALAKISEMQAAIQALMAQYNTAIMDGQLQSLGAALAATAAFEGAGKALEEAKLEKAAKELEEMEEPKLTSKEAKALEEQLKQVAKKAGDVGLGGLSAAVGDLAEAVKGGKGTGKATKKLGKEVAKAARRKKLNDLLAAEVDNLKESKFNVQRNSLAKGKKPEVSKSPSSNWGMGTSGNGLGEKTKLASQRNEMNLTGNPSDEGPSEIETTTSPEARQQASRSYKEKYQKYKKESETVLEGEAIPLGQRQMIRKYFESIRPQNNELPDKPEKDSQK
jgi:hypothetical protein